MVELSLENRVLKPEATFCENVKMYFKDYCNCTSVHGFRYFGEKKRSLFERVWWFIVFTTCLTAGIMSIYQVYKKWEENPVIVSFSNKATPIYTIPFPAVTLCSEAKFSQDKFNYTKVMQKKVDNKSITNTENINFDYMSLICEHLPELNYTNNKTFSEKFYDVLHEVKPKFEIHNCTFMGESINCSSIFIPIITDEGICYTYNMVNRNEMFKENVVHYKNYHLFHHNITDWSLENGYTDGKLNVHPERAYLEGATNGFSFNIWTPDTDLDYACRNSLQGYRVLLHAPMTIPRPSQSYFRVPLSQSIVGQILPVVVTTSDSIKKYSAEKRRCYFVTERYLKYFKMYTSTNCKIECLTNYTLPLCGCVNFFMPRENETKICGSGSIECMKRAERNMHIADLTRKLAIKKSQNASFMRQHCNCLPICSDLTYEASISQTELHWEKLIDIRKDLREFNNSHLSSVTLYFKSDTFIPSERNNLYGPFEFIANFGGVLGLFTGFSMLSLMEILYFLTLRIVYNKKLYGKWAGKENQLDN